MPMLVLIKKDFIGLLLVVNNRFTIQYGIANASQTVTLPLAIQVRSAVGTTTDIGDPYCESVGTGNYAVGSFYAISTDSGYYYSTRFHYIAICF